MSRTDLPDDLAPAGCRLRFADWTLDTGSNTLLDRRGQATHLGTSPLALLTAFVQHPFLPLTREQLFAVLGREYLAYDRLIDVHISQIRRVLGRCADGSSYIRTLRSEGYVFIVPVEVLQPAT
ncbi:MAG: winged helix-turn-helix transcriptional regulator [Dechloromonas sp.]|nr:MAG: winged helix-turn-helix transcriptional regulator [Dechloromonas sp.]